MKTDMDLLDFTTTDLYFDLPLPAEVEELLAEASGEYGEGGGELPLLRAFLRAPDHLAVLVALYRFYFYRHRYDEALRVAERACRAAGAPLGFPPDFRELNGDHLTNAVMRSMGLVRFYLLTLKAAGYLLVRLGETAEGRARLAAVRALDPPDRLGTGALIEVIDGGRRVG